MPLVELVCELLGARSVDDLGRRGRLRDRISKELKGVSVTTTHRGDLKQRFRIGSVSEQSTAEYSFEMDGKRITMADYFKNQYNLKLKYPWLPVVFKGNGKTGFPMECLVITPSQKFTKRLSGQQVSDMIKATVQKPQERSSKINNAVKSILDYKNNPYMKSFGLEVSDEMMKVPARQLPAPELQFADRRTLSGKDGVWNLRGVRLVSTPPLQSIAFVFFVRVRMADAEDIRDVLLDKWAKTGVDIRVNSGDVPIVTQDPNAPGGIGSALKSAFESAMRSCKSRCQLIVCILDKEPKSLYQDIKRITLTEAGVLSQCLQYSHVSRANAIKDQYAANVAMKVNIKLGGATNTVDVLPGFDKPTMLVGADVTHPAPGSMAPSVAAIVTSMDKHATRYSTFLRVQGSRVEIIADMEAVIGEGLDRFKASLSVYPMKLIFFRDGVGSGQFREVRNQEVMAVKRALEARGLTNKCQVTFVVVQKRHHIRLFPEGGVSDRSGNCVPGTVIDSHIVHPFEYNFILQSHAGIQGTSRPAIYHVIYDEIKMHPDKLQQLCYNLCFLAERATRSISFVAPSYRAHLAAFCMAVSCFTI
jgi:eukaryotic translation initiation factor 2C